MGIIRQHKPLPLVLTPEQVSSLQRTAAGEQSIPPLVTPPPTLVTKVVHATQAGARIVKAVVRGQPVRVSDEERERRLSICRGCDYWNEEGNVGLGECRHSDCGCSRWKHGFATEKCPLDKWPVLF